MQKAIYNQSEKKRLKSSSPKVPIVGECFGYSQASHDGERNMVHNAGIISFAALVGQPCRLPIFSGRRNETMAYFHLLAQPADCGTIRPASGGVAAFEQDETAVTKSTRPASNFDRDAFDAPCHWSLSSQRDNRPTVSKNTVMAGAHYGGQPRRVRRIDSAPPKWRKCRPNLRYAPVA